MCIYDSDCCDRTELGDAVCTNVVCNRAGECYWGSLSSAGIFDSEYTFSVKDMVIMVLVVLNLVTMFAIFCTCLRSRNGGVARRSGKYQVVSMAGDSECEMMNNRAV